MSKIQRAQWLHAAGIGTLFACLGFSLALATAGSRGLSAAAARALLANGSRPGRPGPQIVTEPNLGVIATEPSLGVVGDMGVVVAGTQFTREIIARYGFKPHRFFFGSQPLAGATLSEGGLLSGALGQTTATSTSAATGPQTFDVQVQDQVAGELSLYDHKFFSIATAGPQYSPGLDLMFVNGPVLPDAVADEPYSFTLHANGGQAPYVFQFLEDADFLALPVGLSLNVDQGIITGKPVAPTPPGQTADFTITLSDAAHTVIMQKFHLTVLPGTINTEFVATAGSFVLRFGQEGSQDSLRLSLLLNKTDLATANVRHVSDLAGMPFFIDFGGATLPPPAAISSTGQTMIATTAPNTYDNTFDKSGKFYYPRASIGFMEQKGKKLKYGVSLNPSSGVLTVSFDNIDLIKALGANFAAFDTPRGPGDSRPGPVIPVRIRIGAPAAPQGSTLTVTNTPTGGIININTPATGSTVNFDKTDVVKFLYARNAQAVGKGTARASDRLAPAGLFLVTKVQGKELKVAANRDILYLRVSGLLRQVGGQTLEIKGTDTVSVLLGMVNIGSFNGTDLIQSGQGQLTFTNANQGAVAQLLNFNIDNQKGTFYFDTHGLADSYGLDPGSLFQVDFLKAGEPYVMPVTLTVTRPGQNDPVFDGQSPVTIFRKGNTIQNK
ncbi:MAG: Ig domain-containing protein [Planctomycetota bacterium]